MSVENKEEVSNWRELREEAQERAQELIAGIPGFREMDVVAQVAALKVLEESLTDHNENRFIAGEVAREREVIEEIERHRGRMARYGITI